MSMPTSEKQPVDGHNSPPSYSSSLPPQYQDSPTVPSTGLKDIPSSFLIGSSRTAPLLSGPTVLAHLRLLGAFYTLEHSVSVTPSHLEDPTDPPGVVRWRVFIHQAVWRFEIWLRRVVKPRGVSGGRLKDEEIPPVDVLLVWHAYLLNPRVYTDDTMRVHPELAALGGLPLERIAAQIDPATLRFEPTPAQAALWETKTLAPREPLSLSLSSRDELAVECPRCGGPPVQVAWLREPYTAPNGHTRATGWCQNQFYAICGSCQFRITREAIAVGRFAADIAVAMVDSDAVLPGTLFDPIKCTPSTVQAKLITTLLLQPFVDVLPIQQAIGEHLGWSFTGIESRVTEARDTLVGVVRAGKSESAKKKLENTGLPKRAGTEALAARIGAAQADVGVSVRLKWRSFGPRIAKMLASYRDNPTPFSMDLVGAILRQTTFTSKAFALGWLYPFNPAPPLAQSITRYHNFLHLLAVFSGRFLVPTLDIDLGWHTHQLSGKAYMSDTHRCVGRYVDHDDKVEEGVLSDSFDMTSRFWSSTFKEPYSSCEPTQRARSNAFASIKKLATRLSSSSDPPGLEAATPPDPTTYPSEHPSIVVVQDARIATSRSKRDRKRAKRKSLGTDEQPFLRNVHGDAGVVPGPVGGAIAFGTMGIAGWALLGNVDQSVLNANTVQKGQCCAGYGMPYYAGPMWIGGGVSGGCATGGCSAGACTAGGCGGGGCGGGGGGCGGGGGGCGGGGGGGCGGGS